MEPTRVLIVDDHPVVRSGIKAILSDAPDVEVVGEARDGLEAVDLTRQLLPDAVLMDIRMGGHDGVDATRQIKSLSPQTRVIILSSYEEDDQIFEAIKAGASGYVLKDATPEQLVRSIRATGDGFALMSATVAKKVLEEFRRLREQETLVVDRLGDNLTDREREVLILVGQGRTNLEIAEQLHITDRTVKTHVTNIFSKLQINQRTQAVLYAMRRGLIK